MEILIEEATINDIDKIIKLKQEVWDKLENKDWYIIDSINQEWLKKRLENSGIIIKAVDKNKIVGFLIINNSLKKEKDIIKKVNLEEQTDICIELSNGAVDSAYRGNHLYIKMIQKAEKIIKSRYHKKYILATVHPDNIASLNSILKIGYEVKCRTKMYGDLDRYIVIKELNG